MNIIKEKPKDSYDNKVLDNIGLISFTNYEPRIMGSYKLRSSLYSSDIDLFSKIDLNVPEPEKFIYKNFRKMFNNLMTNENVYLIDFKCGLDDVLYQELNNVEDIKQFYTDRKKFIKPIFYKNLMSIDNLDELKEFCRKLYTLRWDFIDINKGFKILYPDRKKSFIDSIKDKTLIKLDIISYINGDFVEISNIYEFYDDGKGINIDEKISRSKILKSIKEDIEKFKKDKNYVKVFKRYFVIAKLNKDFKLLKLLSNMFNSNIGLLYKSISDFKTIIQLLALKKPPLNRIFDNIQLIKSNLSNIFEFPFNDEIFRMIDNISRTKNINVIIEKINSIVDILSNIVNNNVLKYIKNRKSLYNILK